ncbi:uncharacterized protein LOC135226573 isoform X3 [Macrobrachium nipponense]
MLGLLLASCILGLAGLTCAQPPPIDTLDVLPEEGLDISLSKRDLEFNQYVPGYRLRGEPSCEELRAMWRLSKREARRATSTNQLPRSRPYSYGRLMAFAPDPSAGPKGPVYGRIWKYPQPKSSSSIPTKGAFEKLRTLIGPGDRRGSYDALRKMAVTSTKGSYDKLQQMINRERQEQQQQQQQQHPVALALRAEENSFQDTSQPGRSSQSAFRSGSHSMRRSQALMEPSVEMSPRSMRGSMHFSQQGFVGPLLPADSRPQTSFSPWQPPAPDPGMRGCREVRGNYCREDGDCACAGLYRCNKARCKVSDKSPVVEDTNGGWFKGPLEEQDLGVWGSRSLRQP